MISESDVHGAVVASVGIVLVMVSTADLTCSEKRHESMACGCGCIVYQQDDVLTGLTSEEAHDGAVKEGMRPVPSHACSMMTSEKSLPHRGSFDPLR